MKNIYNDQPWLTLYELKYSNNHKTLKMIAEQIRNGCTDPRFLQQLANCIDPDAKTLSGVKFVVSRPGGSSAPKAAPNLELQTFMLTHVDYLGEPSQSVAMDAAEIFNVSKKTAENALAAARRRAEASPDFDQMMRESVLICREEGHPDFRTSAEILREHKARSAS